MPGKNAASADNQQERLDALWIVGFVDGEGSFLVSLFRNKTTALGWQVFPEFIVTQGARSLKVLEMIRTFFGCGRVFVNRRSDNHHEHLYRYCVRSVRDLRERVVPFFERHLLKTAKRLDFEKFVQVLRLMDQRVHLTEAGLTKIRAIAATMNRKGAQHPESSETIRQNPASAG